MKELVKSGKLNGKYKAYDLMLAAFKHIGMLILGFITARGVVLGEILPFGVSFLAGVSNVFLPSSAIGIFIGYFIPAASGTGFRYIAAAFSVLSIKLMLQGYKKTIENPWFLSFIALLSSAMTSVVTLSGGTFDTLKFIIEALLCGFGAYFVSKSFKAVSKSFIAFTPEELSAILISLSIIILGLFNLEIFGISLGRVLSLFLILISAKYGGILAGSISGTVIAFTSALFYGDISYCGIYALSGLMAGLFVTFGKYAELSAFLATSVLGFVFGGVQNKAIVITEMIIASVLFSALPKKWGIELGKIFSFKPKSVSPMGVKKAISLRLNHAAAVLSEVSDTVEQVSRELGKINAPDYNMLIKNIERDSCVGCKLRQHCWKSKREETLEGIIAMTDAVKVGNLPAKESATTELKGRCVNINKLSESVAERYSEYASRLTAESRIEESRGVVSDQFEGISTMLSDLAFDFENDDKFDLNLAQNAAAALKNLNLRAEECSCRIDKYSRLTLEIKVKREEDTVINKLKIMKLLSATVDRELDVPGVTYMGNDIFISVGERAYYRVDIGVCQSAAGENLCGDSYKYFNDGKGHFIMVLSDGMGTGGRAAVDSAMASGLMVRLINAGFGFNCSLRILNSSMLFKSSDESLATVDIASIDLFTGETELYKAGAAPSVVRRQGKTGKAESTSLPVGILRDIGFDRAAVKIRSDDILVLMSDGAVSDGTDWIRAELECFKDGTAQDLSELLCENARKRQESSHRDDITVMVAKLEKAV